ncbi:hypothetical protein HN031_07455 [Nocardioides sp. zg-1308]|uniref:ATP-binding protein n=1 Tax=Nocardioides sp. zg-1308 TaxID=2736253 RepID=UPI0015521886|nr:hypothetical protein [Nocardioides sp. zg-1308]NPD04519.1 hypothetical protein [Nocardioides sp. zg-1308]
MDPARVLVMGASGSGTTTLARALAGRWAVPHADADDYFWVPTDPPYVDKRPEAERIRLMQEVFLPRPAWVLSGSIMGWGEPVVPLLDAVVFCSLAPDVRLQRLRDREAVRYGDRIEPGGDLVESHAEFIAWAAGYEDPAFDGRSRAVHEEWLAGLACPVLRVDTAQPVEGLLQEIAEDPSHRVARNFRDDP